MNIAVILFGPPGSGKGTQAQLLADKLNLFHFDTGKYIRDILYNSEFKNDASIKKERNLNESGQLNTSSWVFEIVSKKIKEIDKINKGIVLSGSPRTVAEAFGKDLNSSGLMNILEKDYGKKNIFVFILQIPAKESIKRNSHRMICSICRTPVLNISIYKNINMSKCPFCGGKMNYRFDDKEKIIVKRLKEYKTQTEQIINKLKEKRFKIIIVNGTPLPYKVHQLIMAKIAKFH